MTIVFVEVVLETKIVDLSKLRELLLLMPESHRDLTRERLEGLIARLTR